MAEDTNEDVPPEGMATEPGSEPGVDASEREGFVEYGIEDKPPLLQSIFLGGQHYLTMIGANIAVPLLLANAMGMPNGVTAQFVGTFFVVSGIATLAQTTIGNRYPIVQGASFAILAPALAVIGVMQTSGVTDWNTMILQLQGAVIIAAAAEVVFGYLGLVGRLKRYLSPVVIAPTIALIGLSLFSASQIVTANQNWWLLGLTLVLIIAFSQYLESYSRAFRLYPVLLGVIAAWGVAAVLSATGVIAPNTPGHVDFSTIANAPALVVPTPFQWGMPAFTSSFVIGIFAGFVASMVESFGDYHAVARLSGVGAPSKRRIDHGIGMEGVSSVFAGIMGTGVGCTSYSENVGAIGLTGVASRYVVQVGAVVMLLAGFVGYFGALITTIPDPVVGGLFVAMFGQIAAVGLSNLKYVDLDSSRNIFIIGLALFVGLSFPEYMATLEGASALRAGFAGIPILGPVLGTEIVANTVYVVGGTGMAVGGLVAFVLDNTVPGTAEERGLEEWEEITEEEHEFESAYQRYVGGD